MSSEVMETRLYVCAWVVCVCACFLSENRFIMSVSLSGMKRRDGGGAGGREYHRTPRWKPYQTVKLAPNPQWTRSGCGLSLSTSWWGTRQVAMFSGSSCGRSTARRTCCSGWPAKTSKRKSTRAPLRRKRAPSTRTTFPYCRQKRWVWMLGFERWSTGRCRTQRLMPLKMPSYRSTRWCTGTPTHDSCPPTSTSRSFMAARVPPPSPSPTPTLPPLLNLR